MNDDQLITLGGFGELIDDETGDDYRRKELAECAEKHGVEFYPTYYDHELKGTRKAVEAVTLDLYSMGRDEWPDNLLTETEVSQ